MKIDFFYSIIMAILVNYLCILVYIIVSGTHLARATADEQQELKRSNDEQDLKSNLEPSNERSNSALFHQAVDNATQLKNRLEIIDKLEPNLLSKLFDPNSHDWSADGADTTLRQVLFIHRHGDRTPVTFSPGDDLAKEPFWKFHGPGQLTNRGKARLYLLGKMIRARYEKFLGNSVNKDQRISRSSGALRCIESAQMFLSGFLALNTTNSTDSKQLVWDYDFNELSRLWQPASIQSVPAHLDGMLAESAICNALDEEYDQMIANTEFVEQLNEDFKSEAEILDKSIAYKIDRYYKWSWVSSLISIERSYFPEKMKPEILKIYDRVQRAGELAYTAYVYTFKSRQLRGGLLLNAMINNMKTVRDNLESNNHQSSDNGSSELKKFVHYTGHDLNLIVILSMLGKWANEPKVPDFASNMAIELHEINHEWFVRIFYMQSVPGKPKELYLSGCQTNDDVSESPEGFIHVSKRFGGIIELFSSQKRVKEDVKYPRICTLDEFEKLMKPYLIDDWESWMKKCKNDFSHIDPYVSGN